MYAKIDVCMHLHLRAGASAQTRSVALQQAKQLECYTLPFKTQPEGSASRMLLEGSGISVYTQIIIPACSRFNSEPTIHTLQPDDFRLIFGG